MVISQNADKAVLGETFETINVTQVCEFCFKFWIFGVDKKLSRVTYETEQ